MSFNMEMLSEVLLQTLKGKILQTLGSFRLVKDKKTRLPFAHDDYSKHHDGKQVGHSNRDFFHLKDLHFLLLQRQLKLPL